MTRLLVAAVLALCLHGWPAFAQRTTVPFVVFAEPAEDADELLLAGRTGNVMLPADFTTGSTRVDLPAGPASDQPRVVILEWRDGTSAEFPVFIFPEFAKYEVQLRFLHMRELPQTQSQAYGLCRDSEPSDIGFAFEMVFGCRMWAAQLETRNRKWSKEYNWAIKGWIIGNRFLFRRTVDASNDQFSPFGYQVSLITRLREATDRVRNGLDPDRLSPLNMFEVSDILLEHDQTLLRYVSQTGSLIEQGRLLEAQELNRQAYDVYQETVEKGGQPSVFRIDEDVLVNQLRTLRELIHAP